jgi:beta-xylosidase
VGVAAVGALVAVLVGAILVSIRHSPTTRVPTSPVLGPARVVYEGDIGDPVVMPVTSKGGAVSFVAFGTGDRRARVPTAHSADLTTWQQGPDALPVLPDWTAPDPRHSRSWAPAVLDTGHGYVLYVSLPDARSGQQCIGAASSSTPEGPYHGVGDGPLICQHELGGSIDPAVARDRDGSLHLFWKDDANALGQPTSLWEQKLSGDGLGLVGTAHRLLTASRPWQGGIIEEPAVIAASGAGWWLFYSGNSFDRPEYATGLAFCPTIVGPCREVSDEPFLATPALSQDAQFAPGGLETVRDARGGLWAVFDTWNRPARDGRFHCCRSLQMAPLVSH